jgi:hypothetical protein
VFNTEFTTQLESVSSVFSSTPCAPRAPPLPPPLPPLLPPLPRLPAVRVSRPSDWSPSPALFILGGSFLTSSSPSLVCSASFRFLPLARPGFGLPPLDAVVVTTSPFGATCSTSAESARAFVSLLPRRPPLGRPLFTG